MAEKNTDLYYYKSGGQKDKIKLLSGGFSVESISHLFQLLEFACILWLRPQSTILCFLLPFPLSQEYLRGKLWVWLLKREASVGTSVL